MGPSPAKLWPSVAPEWILNLPEWLEDLCFDFYKSFLFDNRYEMYIEGLGNTLMMTLFALMMGVVLGVVVALIRATWDKNGSEMYGVSKVFLRIANALCNVYLTAHGVDHDRSVEGYLNGRLKYRLAVNSECGNTLASVNYIGLV